MRLDSHNFIQLSYNPISRRLTHCSRQRHIPGCFGSSCIPCGAGTWFPLACAATNQTGPGKVGWHGMGSAMHINGAWYLRFFFFCQHAPRTAEGYGGFRRHGTTERILKLMNTALDTPWQKPTLFNSDVSVKSSKQQPPTWESSKPTKPWERSRDIVSN